MDGHKINIYANIGGVSDVGNVLENDAGGIGLFRSEFSCKTCYYELFPEANERMRQRDFKQLNNIGYTITYNNYERRYKMWEGSYLREDFGVFLKNGKLMRYMGFDLY